METIMNFVSVEAKALTKALKIATAIVEPRNTIPILSCIRLAYDKKGLTIEATDLDIYARIGTDEIDGDGTWAICLPARDLAAIAQAAGVAALRIEVAATQKTDKKAATYFEHTATIAAGDATYEVQGQDPADYPQIAGERMQRIERFSNGMMVAMLKKVSFCISTEETRYYLNGVNWSAKPGAKRFAATDGHRLALCRYDGNDSEAAFSYIIPRKTVSVLSQFLDGADIEAHSVGSGNTVNDNVLDLVAPGIQIRTKLIDGNYPDIDRVVPQAPPFSMAIKRPEILNAIKQATAIGGYRNEALRFHGVDGRLHIEKKNMDFGTARISTSSPWPAEIADSFGLNCRYITEMVTQCQGEIAMGISGARDPFLITDDDKDMTRVIMPMRV
jgi:DNA polymerase-3 subunit beta